MKLSETNFDQFVNWCEENKKQWSNETQYVTIQKLRVIYEWLAAHNLKCEGNRCRVSLGRETISYYTEPLKNLTEEDLLWNLFHEVWCKTEWAVRCTRTKEELGYNAVKYELGLSTIKKLKEVM